MSVTEIGITGFRSIRSIRFPLRQLTVLVGSNGVGKTNLYRSLELLRAAYEIEVGFPVPIQSAAFPLEAQIKEERLHFVDRAKRVVLMERKGPAAWVRGAKGERQQADEMMLTSEVALAALGSVPELLAVRQALTTWRFFHSFRTDQNSPLRRPCRAITSPLLASDGSNLASVFATLRHIRQESVDVDAAIDFAFPGAELVVPLPEEFASFGMIFPETPKRVFQAHELSDGTLHFLALMGALLSYRLPPFIALNEPETSLHPDLLPALAKIIARAAERTQVWVVTHSRELAAALAEETGVLPREVIRKDGGTWLEGLTQLASFEDD